MKNNFRFLAHELPEEEMELLHCLLGKISPVKSAGKKLSLNLLKKGKVGNFFK